MLSADSRRQNFELSACGDAQVIIVRLDTPVDVDYYKNGGTAKRANGVEEAGAGSVKCET